MTQEQIELLLKYIDLRAQRISNLPDNTNLYYNLDYSKEEAKIIQDLIKTLENH
jgi:hypothetical protein